MLADIWLARAFSNPRAEVILREDGKDWVSAKRAWKLDEIAQEIWNPTRIIGLRPEGLVRAIFFDFDHKAGGNISPYWHEKAKSPQLLQLQEEAEACGLQITYIVSSCSGGLHGILSLPVATKAWLAHWIGVVLLEKCNMTEGAGKAEIFPSEIKYVKDANQSNWGRSNGVRLPGQAGSKLITGETFADDCEVIYEQLVCDIENTEDCEQWRNLVQEAQQRSKIQKKNQWQAWQKRGKSAKTVKWTGSGQSENNLRQITTAVRVQHPEITSEHELAVLIRETAISAQGFWEFASEQTKKELSTCLGWALRWARSSLRRIMQACSNKAPAARKPNANNLRVFESSRNKLRNLYKLHPESASWSLRKVSRETGLAKRTVTAHKEFWFQLVGHSETPITGGGSEVVALAEEDGLTEAQEAPTVASDGIEEASTAPSRRPAAVKSASQSLKQAKIRSLAERKPASNNKKPSTEGQKSPNDEDCSICDGRNSVKCRPKRPQDVN